MAKTKKPKGPSAYDLMEWLTCEGCIHAGEVKYGHHFCKTTKMITPYTVKKPCKFREYDTKTTG